MRATQRQDVDESGAIAQLGERNTGSVEVSGSIPLSSTKLKTRLSQDKRVFCYQVCFLIDSIMHFEVYKFSSLV